MTFRFAPVGSEITPKGMITNIWRGWFLDLVNGLNNLSSSGTNPSNVFLKPVSYYGIFSSTSIDYTNQINTAAAAAAAAGVGLLWDPGIYIYTGPITNTVSWYGTPGQVELRNNAVLGKGARIDNTNTVNQTIRDIIFNSPNTPANATNNATESDQCLRFTGGENVLLAFCYFKNQFGGISLFRNINRGRELFNKVFKCCKDGFHVTGTSTNIERIGNQVECGGDDAFPVVGYLTGTGAGQPKNILDIGNVVNGCRFGRAFAYVGADTYTNVGCKVDGTVPASYSPTTPDDMSCPALLIISDGTFNTYGNKNGQVIGFEATNVGNGAAPFTSVYAAVQVNGRAGQETSNLLFKDLTISRCASKGFVANGGVTDGIEGLTIEGISVNDTTDPNGYTTSAGGGQFTGIDIGNVKDLILKGTVKDSGGHGIALNTATLSGSLEVKLKTSRINAGNRPTTARIIDGGTSSGSSLITRADVRLYVAEQASVLATGSQYFLSQPLLWGALGAMGSLEIEYDRSILGLNGCQFNAGLAVTNVAITASPMTYTNLSGAKQIVRLRPGTSTGLTVGRGQAGSPGDTISPTVGSFYFTLNNNESLVINYIGAGTLSLTTQPAEGF